jgi:hypothetical protein
VNPKPEKEKKELVKEENEIAEKKRTYLRKSKNGPAVPAVNRSLKKKKD